MPDSPAQEHAGDGHARPDHAARESQSAFAAIVAGLLRASRRRQGLTQAQVAKRTAGLVSKAALANYETGHRSLRVDVFWVLARALGENPGTLLAGAERASGYGIGDDASPIVLDVALLRENSDARLAPVRRWFAVRLQAAPAARGSVKTVALDHGALSALAKLMGVSVGECRRLLLVAAAARPQPSLAAAGRQRTATG